MSAPARPETAGVVVYRRTVRADAIDEYSRRLVGALNDAGVGARYVADGLAPARRRVARPNWILLQYNPFAYGRWGVAPGLVAGAWTYRRCAAAPLAVMVHEAWVEAGDRGRARWRSTLMGAYQRAQLACLLGVADVVLCATQDLARRVGHDAIHVPVASNVTPLAETRAQARRRLGLGDELVVCLLGTGHPSRALEYATAAIELLAATLGPARVKVLNLGFGAPGLGLAAAGVSVDTPGHLDEAELSLRLRAGDLLLLPFADGISTRRTTLMAGLAHGLPVAALRAPGSDDVLTASREAITLTPVGDVGAFARAVVALVGDRDRLRRRGVAAGELYARAFDWPILAGRVTAALGLDPGPRA